MGKKRTREKGVNRPAKPRYTCMSNVYHQKEIAPLEKKYRQALNAKNYEVADTLLRELTKAQEEHRLWHHRKEKVRIK
ncbi:hypothetical protein H1164_08580 [Thermoactinomyces daqus]|uniref:Uncharacterized protein n=1 Tax=Thermoactinomyces daqus TaxID=1329516 RepID=A0A7W1XA72_9BACL|nr:hypothetical protein [Thermoactinomyces daqus]MBA4542957.1 hypothetical protein [Thermoactinomyces daqus]